MAQNVLPMLLTIGYGLLFVIAGGIIYIVQSRRQRHMTAETTGHICRYSYLGENNIAPVVSYTVDGKKYEVRRKFRSIVTKSFKSADPTVADRGAYVTEKDVLVIHTGNITNFETMMEELWPLGMSVPVFYNPQKPKAARAEKFLHLPCVVSIVFFWVGLGIILLGIVLWIFLP